jgi:hypothetical protein
MLAEEHKLINLSPPRYPIAAWTPFRLAKQYRQDAIQEDEKADMDDLSEFPDIDKFIIGVFQFTIPKIKNIVVQI